MSGFSHVPVMLRQTLEALRIRPDGIYLDGTAGGGGHSFGIASQLDQGGRLICIDQDEDAISAVTKRLEPYRDRVTIVRGNYGNAEEILNELGIGKLDGVLLDLGVSSHQLDTPERGFSYQSDAPLDMRMDQRNPLTAAMVVNEYPEEELFRIIRDYGEDRFAGNIAKNIVKARKDGDITGTLQLSEIIGRSVPAKYRMTGPNPAMRTFQAIRIEVNRELSVLEGTLSALIDRLQSGGRIAVITFHSLEDRICKNQCRQAENPCTCPPNFPVCVCGKKSKGRVVFKKPLVPDEKELEQNKRSHSAKLRVFERE